MSIMITRLTLTSVLTWRKNYIKNTWKSAQQHKKWRHLALWRYEYEGAGYHLKQKGRAIRVPASIQRCFSDYVLQPSRATGGWMAEIREAFYFPTSSWQLLKIIDNSYVRQVVEMAHGIRSAEHQRRKQKGSIKNSSIFHIQFTLFTYNMRV